MHLAQILSCKEYKLFIIVMLHFNQYIVKSMLSHPKQFSPQVLDTNADEQFLKALETRLRIGKCSLYAVIINCIKFSTFYFSHTFSRVVHNIICYIYFIFTFCSRYNKFRTEC